MNLFKVVCKNDEHKPNDFPSSKWIRKDQEYTVINILNHVIQGGQGFVLEEIDMTGCEPFVSFGAWRFSVPVEIVEEELVEENAL